MDELLEEALLDHDSGRYRRQYERVVSEFIAWCRSEGIDEVAQLDESTLRDYARHLSARERDDEIAASTANTYYNIVRAFLAWCVRNGHLETNPAERDGPLNALPSPQTDQSSQQFWDREDREALLEHADRAVDEAMDDGDTNFVLQAHRDRVIAYLLAYSGVRGAEIARLPDDDRRDGLRWRDVDLDQGTIRVLGKSGDIEYPHLLSPVVERLDRYRRVLDPPDEDWPVLPSTSYRVLYDEVGYRDADQHPLEAAREDATPGERLRNISTHSVRNVMKRLSEAAGVDVSEGYLQPHGARRALGSELYEQDAELAQETLRHQDISVTHEAYREVQAAKRREDVEEVLFDQEDGR